jgi:hypothetical protein
LRRQSSSWWETSLGFQWGARTFAHSLLHWVNHGLLTVFFFIVGLEIKREFTVGHLATFRSGALPLTAAGLGVLVLWPKPELADDRGDRRLPVPVTERTNHDRNREAAGRLRRLAVRGGGHR